MAAIEGPAQLKAAVDYILSIHREIGVMSSRITQLDITELSPRLTGMMLRYELTDKDGKRLYDMQCFYSLSRTDRGYRIAGLTHNQLPRLLARYWPAPAAPRSRSPEPSGSGRSRQAC